jgi:callose synthase
MARYYQVAYALYEVLRDVTNNKVDPQVMCFNCLLEYMLFSYFLGQLLQYNFPL